MSSEKVIKIVNIINIIFLVFILVISVATTFIILLTKGETGSRGLPGNRGIDTPNPKNEIIESEMNKSTLNLQVNKNLLDSLGNFNYFTDDINNYNFSILSGIFTKQNILTYSVNRFYDRDFVLNTNGVFDFSNFVGVDGENFNKTLNISMSGNELFNLSFGVVSLDNNQIIVFQNMTSV